MYNIGKNCELGNVSISENGSCESCGDLEPFDINWSDGLTWWCVDCATLNEEFSITKLEMKELLDTQKFLKREYYEKKLAELD